ncbi:MAG: hypothetical protein HY537_08505 [Deltaproteobacteria bacterium]|nr:hypothetical protein [Deltaproteobacteria bacterium]
MRLTFVALFIGFSFISKIILGNKPLIEPGFEGIYSMLLVCGESPVSEHCKKIEGETKMVIMNAFLQELALQRVVITIFNSKIQMPLYDFNARQIDGGGASIQADSVLAGRLAEIALQIDLASKKVVGTVKDIRLDADITIGGTQDASPGALYQPVLEVLSGDSVEGKYDVKTPFTNGVLTVRRIPSGSPNFVARCVLDTVELMFDSGEFDSAKGVLNLMDNQSMLKWTLALSKGSDGFIEGKGLSVSAHYGTSYSLSAKGRRKVSDY